MAIKENLNFEKAYFIAWIAWKQKPLENQNEGSDLDDLEDLF